MGPRVHKSVCNVNGLVAYKSANQCAELKVRSTDMDLDTPFLIGSVSKQFTAILAIKHLAPLLDTEVIALLTDDEFRNILKDLQRTEQPFWPQLKLKDLKGTTIRNILMHYAKVDYATGAPSIGYKYHNLNYALVAKCLEKQTKQRFSKLAHDLFSEAGLTNTFLHDDFSEQELWMKLQKALALAKCSPEKLRNPLTATMNPAGGIVSTTRDLLKWNEFLRRTKYFDALTQTTIPTGEGGSYGFGIITNESLFFHTGTIAAVHLDGILFTCVLIYDKTKARSFVGFDVANITDAPDDMVKAKIDERIETLMQFCAK
jgi:CubicO group peptidase (beta-lactamase class C family)